MNCTLQKEKQALRQQMKEKANEVSLEYRKRASEDICRQVIDSLEFQEAENVFLFSGVFNEPDTAEIISYALEKEKTVALPLCYKGGSMEGRIILSIDDLTPGMFGIMEPPRDAKIMEPEQIDFALVPCVAASMDGKRLGHGMGYYDRFLEKSKSYKTVVCFDLFLQDEIPTDEFDIIADRVIINQIK